MEIFYLIVGLLLIGVILLGISFILNCNKFSQLIMGVILIGLGTLIKNHIGENSFYLGTTIIGFLLFMYSLKRIFKY